MTDVAPNVSPPDDPKAEPRPAWYRAETATGAEAAADAAEEGFAGGIPTLRQRVEGVLLRPAATFRALDERAGWLVPWLVVAIAGLIVGAVTLATVDLRALIKREQEMHRQAMPPQFQRMMAEAPNAQEGQEMGERWGLFMARASLVAGPLVGSLFATLAVGGVMFAASWALGGRRDFLRAFVAAAHANLVSLVKDGAVLIGLLSGNPMPQTNLSNLVENRYHAPYLTWALSSIDPLYWWWVLLLFLGLHLTMRVERRRAIAASAVLAAIPVALALLGAVASGMMGKFGGSS